MDQLPVEHGHVARGGTGEGDGPENVEDRPNYQVQMRVITIPPAQLDDGDTEMLVRYAVADLLALGGRERTFRETHGCMIGAQQVCLFGHECETVWVEVNE
jgi:hypothetical protein